MALAAQADLDAAVACIGSWLEDFTGDLAKVTVPTLVIHGDSDAIVPIEVSGRRTHDQVEGSELVTVKDRMAAARHRDEFHEALVVLPHPDRSGRCVGRSSPAPALVAATARPPSPASHPGSAL